MSSKILNGKIISFMGLENVEFEFDPSYEFIAMIANGRVGKSSFLEFIRAGNTGIVTEDHLNLTSGIAKGHINYLINGEVIRVEISASTRSNEYKVYNGNAKLGGRKLFREMIGGAVEINPFDLLRMKPAEQLKTLRKWLGIDTSELDAKRSAVFSERTMVNNRIKTLQGFLELDEQATLDLAAKRLRLAEDKPLGDLPQKRDEAIRVNNERAKKETVLASYHEAVGRKQIEVDRLQEELRLALQDLEATRAERKKLHDELQAKPEIPLKPILEEIDQINEHNRERAEFQSYLEKLKEKEDSEKEAKRLTEQIEIYTTERKKHVEEKLKKVEGVSILEPKIDESGKVIDDREGLLYFEKPAATMSTTEKLMFGFGIHDAMVEDPNAIKVILVDDYERAGADAEFELWRFCKERGYTAIVAIQDRKQQDLKMVLKHDLHFGKKSKTRKEKILVKGNPIKTTPEED